MADELTKHLHYLGDSRRLQTFSDALQLVAKGSVVLDLGCGTGILGLLACRHGATKVYAVDRGGILEIARNAARASGYGDRIVHLHGDSELLDLPEPVDVIVADQLGPLGFEAGVLEAVPDAVQRFLRPGGHVLPAGWTTWFAPVEAPGTYEAIEGWGRSYAGFRFDLARIKAAGRALRMPRGESRELGAPAPGLSFDLSTGSKKATGGDATWRIVSGGTFHGLEGWFHAVLGGGMTLTNSPNAVGAIRRSAGWLPLVNPLPVEPHDEVRARFVVAGRVISWQIETWRGGTRLASSEQSSMDGWLFGGERLQPLTRENR